METLNALFFINFIALILRHRLLKIMVDKGLSKKYSLEKIMFELGKIILTNGNEVISEITKRQREIIEKLNPKLEYVPKKREFRL